MSQNENNNLSDELKTQMVFNKLRSQQLEPSPYMKTRVLAHVKEGQKLQKTIRFWQLFSATSFSVMLLIGLYAFNFVKTVSADAAIQQAYVIHVEFDQDDMSRVARAEVVLPENVHFMSKKGMVKDRQSLTLPVQIKNAGRAKLPFVVASSVEGEQNIKVRLLDENNVLVREQVLKFKFAKTGEQVSL